MLPASCVLPSSTFRMANDIRRLLGVSKVMLDNRNCPICLDEFDEPKCLPCAHSFCLECLEKTTDSSIIRCPLCQRESELPNGSASELPINPVLVQLLDSSPGTGAKNRIREKLKKSRQEVGDFCSDRYQAFKQESETLRENSNLKQKEIHQAADKLVEAIRQQEENLCAEVEDFEKSQEEILRKKWKAIEECQGDFEREASRIEDTVKRLEKTVIRKQRQNFSRQMKEAKITCIKRVAAEGQFQACRAKFVPWDDVTNRIISKNFGTLIIDTEKRGVRKALESFRSRLPTRDSIATSFRSVSRSDLDKDEQESASEDAVGGT